jgi:hypothetical protein
MVEKMPRHPASFETPPSAAPQDEENLGGKRTYFILRSPAKQGVSKDAQRGPKASIRIAR